MGDQLGPSSRSEEFLCQKLKKVASIAAVQIQHFSSCGVRDSKQTFSYRLSSTCLGPCMEWGDQGARRLRFPAVACMLPRER